MQVNYSLSHSLIATNTAATVDLILNFNGEKTASVSSRRPLNLSLVIDRSASMAGQPLRYAIQAAQKLVESLTDQDIVSVVIYDDNADLILPPQQVKNPSEICKILGKIKAGGCTNLSGGWLLGCEQVKSCLNREYLNRVLLLTDGQANEGITDPQILTKTAYKQSEQGIITTTLGFGTYFNEDLLMGMAKAAGGNFYFIQSPDEATDVFRIELESLTSVVGQNLTVTLHPESLIELREILNNYRTTSTEKSLEIFVGDVYEIEAKQLAVQLVIPAQNTIGQLPLISIHYQYQTLVNDSIEQLSGELPITINIGSEADAQQVQPDQSVFEQTSKLRIAQVKEQAIALTDKGEYQKAAETLRSAIQDIQQKLLNEIFEIAEEIEQLEYYAQRIETQNFDSVSRKEMRDQSYQTRTRNREDLNLRGIAAGDADSLEAISSFEQGVLVECIRQGGKLRVRVISDGYNPEFNVQFPRHLREEGVTYIVEEIKLSANGDFYRASGTIKRLVKPGEERKAGTQKTPKTTNLQAAKAPKSFADLETTDTVGNGVIIQCVKAGSKLRARVVSDGYNPNYNIRFPRDIRAEGVLYVVDEVRESSDGKSYVAYGKIRRLIQ
ncbi:VWA domain-containing protein [Planktothrix mougeotii LEGE 06226]|uniref:VWA domain-containing protein n=1 Tax=Planktothrix mougeotii LEGE 06226 TaxID=1828728 RepID=A0ABR9UBH1_9CYAN|nr:VWA domain-containing protein [Planktothrix mougeotii LEGE 06226]